MHDAPPPPLDRQGIGRIVGLTSDLVRRRLAQRPLEREVTPPYGRIAARPGDTFTVSLVTDAGEGSPLPTVELTAHAFAQPDGCGTAGPGEPPVPGGGGLPSTGAPIGLVVAAGAALLALGIELVTATRRRRLR